MSIKGLSTRYDQQTVDLIRAFESQNLLWNKKHPRYTYPMYRNAAYTAIANAMEMQQRDVKMKIKYLTGWFRLQKRLKTVQTRWWTPYMSFYEPHCHEENNAGISNNNNNAGISNNNNAEETATEDGNDSSVDPQQQTVEQQNDTIIEIDEDSVDLLDLLDASTAYDYYASVAHLFMNY